VNVKKQLMVVGIAVFMLLGVYRPLAAGNFQGSLYFDMGFPNGEFKDNLDKTGLGMGLNFGIKLGDTPFVLGLDLSIMNYGSDKRYETLTEIPEFTVKVVNSYNIFQGLVFLRFQPLDRAPVSPYCEVLAGMNYLWAETSIEDDGWGPEILSTVNFDDYAFSYGIGGGMMIHFGGTRKKPDKRSRTKFFLDLRARYIFGGNAQYLQEGSIVINGDDVTFYYSESKTDLLNLQIGLGIKF